MGVVTPTHAGETAYGSADQGKPAAARSLVASLRHFLTPALWKQARQARGPRRQSRWGLQPLALVLLGLTWACGDSGPERFETARAFVAACLPKRRRPGKTVSGFQKALARLPMPVLRVLAAGVRRRVREALAARWHVEGYVPLGCDGTRLECPRAAQLERRLGPAGPSGAAPTLWLTARVHLRLGVPWAWRWGQGTASERDHLRRMLPVLPAAALLVADAGYVGYDLMRTLLQRRACFLIRMSSKATFYREGRGRPSRFRDGVVYYWPPSKKKGESRWAPLRVRLIRVRGRRGQHDVWLATNVLDRGRLSAAQAGRFYRWRWESEGLFRTYKRTLAKMKLHSRTVRLVHREAEGSLLATQLLLAQGAPAGQRQGATGRAAADAAQAAQTAAAPHAGGGRKSPDFAARNRGRMKGFVIGIAWRTLADLADLPRDPRERTGLGKTPLAALTAVAILRPRSRVGPAGAAWRRSLGPVHKVDIHMTATL